MRRIALLITAIVLAMTMSVPAFAASVDKDGAIKIALKNAKLTKSQVKYLDAEYDSEDGRYEVEFTKKKNGAEYDYEITKKSGKIKEKSVEYKYTRNKSHDKIGKKKARKKVAKFSGISYKVVASGTCTYKYEDRQGEYKVRFRHNGKKYEYEVQAPTGKIMEYEWKR